MKKKYFIFITLAIAFGFGIHFYGKKHNINPTKTVGEKIDSLNNVYVYYNGGIHHVSGRNTTKDNYNLGLKYQCVEFVKRYYYEALQHKMPNSYGHAKNFFNSNLKDGQRNTERNLLQFKNGSKSKPRVNDIVVYSKTLFNPYGHIAIISKVTDSKIEIIQQNAGPFSSSRENYTLEYNNNTWFIKNNRIKGWLRKE